MLKGVEMSSSAEEEDKWGGGGYRIRAEQDKLHERGRKARLLPADKSRRKRAVITVDFTQEGASLR